MGGKISERLMNMLTEFVLQTIGIKAVDGLTYGFLLKTEKNYEEEYKGYLEIKKEALKCGYGQDEIFRIFEVSNGYIIDVDSDIVEYILKELVKSLNVTNGEEVKTDYVTGCIDKRRQTDMIAFAKYVYTQFEKGKTELEVALFSRNSSPRIMISGIGPKKEMMTVRYNAYAIRHIDVAEVNYRILLPRGVRVARLEPFEILPTRTGVKFKIYIEKVDITDTGW